MKIEKRHLQWQSLAQPRPCLKRGLIAKLISFIDRVNKAPISEPIHADQRQP